MTIVIDGSGTITGASTLATTVASPTLTTPNINSAQFATVTGTAPIYPCRAWVNFNGTGTVAIRASGNVSSITDNGTGLYTVNLSTAMPDANGCVVAFAYKSATDSGDYRTIATGYNTISAGSFGVHTGTAQVDNVTDTPVITAAIFR